VTGVNADQRRVLLSDGTTLDYDFLVIATAPATAISAATNGRSTPRHQDARRRDPRRRNILLAMERAETIRQESLPDRDEYLTFVVVGGGPTGVEMAGAIAETDRNATDMIFRFITRRCLRVMLVEAGDRLLPTFPAKLGDAARKALNGLGVIVRLSAA